MHTIRQYLNIVEQLRFDEVKKRGPTIADASKKGGIDRKISDRIIDPQGYFKPKWPTNGKKS